MGKRRFNEAVMEAYYQSVNAALSDEKNASTEKTEKSVSEYADLLYSTEISDYEEISEDDMLIPRKNSREFFEKDVDALEEEDSQLFKEFSLALEKKSKIKPDKSEDIGEPVKAEKILPNPAPMAPVKEKDKNLSLQELENAMLSQITLIRHDGGVYYYNGRTYVALKNDMEVLEVIRRHGISQNAFQSRSIKIFQDLYTYLKTDPYLIPYDYEERLRKSRSCVVLDNGVLNVKKMELKEFNPKYLTFHSVKANWKQNPYPRRFLKFLNDAAMGDSEIVKLTLEVMGYLLSSLNTAKKFFVIGTAGNSGKSTLALLLKYLIGEEFVTSITPNNLSDRFALGSTRGKILNLAMDIAHGKLSASAVSRLKSITGQDSIVIEEKYQRSENTISNLRFLFGTNYPVTLPQEDDENSFWERMVVIPFCRSVPPSEIDVDLLDDLLDEKDDIVSLCLKNLNTFIKNNHRFSYCQKSEEVKRSWRKVEVSTASFYYFWNEKIEVTGNPQNSVYASTLHSEYLEYCTNNGLDAVPYSNMLDWISRNVDSNLCQKKRIHKTGSNPLSGFIGIKIRNQL